MSGYPVAVVHGQDAAEGVPPLDVHGDAMLHDVPECDRRRPRVARVPPDLLVGLHKVDQHQEERFPLQPEGGPVDPEAGQAGEFRGFEHLSQ